MLPTALARSQSMETVSASARKVVRPSASRCSLAASASGRIRYVATVTNSALIDCHPHRPPNAPLSSDGRAVSHELTRNQHCGRRLLQRTIRPAVAAPQSATCTLAELSLCLSLG